MGKKKKQPKTYINIGNKKVCITELVDQVNAIDKSFGIRLKHHKILSDPNMYRQIITAKADMLIGAIICTLNGIPVENYFETDTETGFGTICKPIGINQPLFTDESILKWESLETYESNTIMFRCRYLTLVLSQFIGEIDDITERYVGRYKNSKEERRIILTKNIVNDLIKFTKIMLNPYAEYQNIILKINEWWSYSKKSVNQSRLRELLNGHVLNTRDSMKENPITGRFASDDMAIYQTLKVAYLLSTGMTNLDVIPKFKHIEGATVKHDLSLLIEELGYAIIENRNNKKYAPLFRAYIEARPIVKSQFYKECKENVALQVGLLSLGYSNFIFHDNTMNRFINEMMNKGI